MLQKTACLAQWLWNTKITVPGRLKAPSIFVIYDSYDTIFQRWTKMPLFWNKETSAFIRIRNHSKLIIFYLNMFIVHGWAAVCWSYLLLRYFFKVQSEIPIALKIVTILCLFIVIYGIVMSIWLVLRGDQFINFWDQQVRLSLGFIQG